MQAMRRGSQVRRVPCANRPGRRLAAAVGLACSVLLAGCDTQPAPGEVWPDGTLVIARREAIVRLASALQAWPESKLARIARETAADLPDCEWLETIHRDTAAAVRMSCHPSDPSLAGLAARRGDADWVFALPKSVDGRVIGTGRLHADGSVESSFNVPASAFEGSRELLRPAAADPGPALLRHADELLHARLRPEGGLNIAALVPSGGQGDQMFRLKSELFAGAVLDGSWEFAVYLPESGRAMPDAALAVGFSLRAPAVSAMEHFISELRASWPIRRTAYHLGRAGGACLRELNLLPDLAPCYVATDSALVVGWNAASLERALGRTPLESTPATAPHPAAGVHVDLWRMSEADARFAALAGDGPVEPAAAPPWRRMSASGRSGPDGVDFQVRLAADGPGDGA